MTDVTLLEPAVDEVAEAMRRLQGGKVVRAVRQYLTTARPGDRYDLTRDDAVKLVEGWAAFVRQQTNGEAETKQAIITAFAREGIVSKGKDGWIGKPCPTCKGHQFVTGVERDRHCGACGGTGEWYIPSLDEREEDEQGKCRLCDGEGIWHDEDGENLCTQCDGTGKMPEA